MPTRRPTWLGKVLVGTIYTAEKPAKMPGEPYDGHRHSFKSETEDWMAQCSRSSIGGAADAEVAMLKAIKILAAGARFIPDFSFRSYSV